MDYTVDLEVYSGPLDLLLYLIKEQEVDIYNIPVAIITDQYIKHLEALQDLDINLAGDFLVMASLLMEIKSRTLLPTHEGSEETEDEEEDPRAELVRQLVEYKKYRDLAGALEQKARERAKVFPRPRELWIDEEEPVDEPLRDVDLWALVHAYAGLLRQTLTNVPTTIIRDDTPIHAYAERVLARLRSAESVELMELAGEARERGVVIGLFMAMLELVKQRKIRVDQDEPFGPIQIHAVPADGQEIPTDPETGKPLDQPPEPPPA